MEQNPTPHHIRPRVRSRVKKNDVENIDQLLEETQQRLNTLLKVSAETTPQVVQDLSAVITTRIAACEESTKPLGILKKPKYTNAAKALTPLPHVVDNKAVVVRSEPECSELVVEDETANAATASTKVAVKDFVVERDPGKIKPQLMPNMNPRSIEGYTPNEEGKEEKGVIFNSSAATPQPPAHGSDESPQVIEADLEFSVMSKQEYDELMEDQRIEVQPADVFRGRFDAFSGDDDEDEDDDDPVFSFRNGEDDEELWSDTDDHMEITPPREPRAFIKLWETLSQWVTPEAIMLLKDWQNDDAMEVSTDWVPVVDTSDIAASRCAGIMALLSMNLQRSLKELGYTSDVDRVAKHRLADLLRSFNYSRSTARLDTSLWRAMTCVLLSMVLSGKEDKPVKDIPDSATAVGLTVEEFSYLTKSCFKSLDAGA